MKLLLSLSTLLSFSALVAQPTIVESFAPVAGTQWTEFTTEDVEGIVLGSSGPLQSWNYTNFSEEFESSVLDFLDPSNLPAGFDGMFPDAEMAFYENEDSTAQFFISESDGFYLDGFATLSEEVPSSSNQQDFEPDLIFLPFDFTYEDSRSEEATSELIIEDDFPILLQSSIFTEMVADGYGTVTTPAGTYSDVLRVRIFQYRIDSVFTDIDMDGDFTFFSTNGPADTTITYNHVQNGEPLLLAGVEMNSDETEVVAFNYLAVGTVGLEESSLSNGLILFPNPSNGLVTLDLTSMRNPSYIAVHDLQGRLVFEANPQTTESLFEMDLTRLDKGFYSLTVVSQGKRTSVSLTIE